MTNEFIRQICFALNGTTEDLKWEHNLCFSVGCKIYCLVDVVGDFGCTFKCTEEDFTTLTEIDGIKQAPYFARNKWVKVDGPASLSKIEWGTFIKKSYELVASKLPRKVKTELGIL